MESIYKKQLGAALSFIICATAWPQEAPMTALRSDQKAYLEIYRELVETNSDAGRPVFAS